MRKYLRVAWAWLGDEMSRRRLLRLCLIAGMPEMVTTIETTVDAVIFPAIALTGLLSFIYGCIWKKPKKKD